jgi:hypothetical protein
MVQESEMRRSSTLLQFRAAVAGVTQAAMMMAPSRVPAMAWW